MRGDTGVWVNEEEGTPIFFRRLIEFGETGPSLSALNPKLREAGARAFVWRGCSVRRRWCVSNCTLRRQHVTTRSRRQVGEVRLLAMGVCPRVGMRAEAVSGVSGPVKRKLFGFT